MPEKQLDEGMKAFLNKVKGNEKNPPATSTEVVVGMLDILIYHVTYRLTDLTRAKWEAAYSVFEKFFNTHMAEINFSAPQLEEKLQIVKEWNRKKKLF